MKKRKRGRPAKAIQDRKRVSVNIRLTPAERARLEARAKPTGKKLSQWARETLLTDRG